MTTLYGISNCDTIKKARNWLGEAGIDYAWHDYKKTGISLEQLGEWCRHLGWESLLNRKGTTWRKLGTEVQTAIQTEGAACQLMQEHPSLIRRPILEHEGQIIAGFTPSQYSVIFNKNEDV